MELSIWQEYQDEEFIMLGISSQTVSELLSFIEDQGITFPILHDDHGVYGDYHLPGSQSPYPRDYIVDREGVLRYASTEYDPGLMIQVLESLFSLDSDGGQGEDLPKPSNVSLIVYPNPTESELTIVLRNPSKSEASVSIYDIQGRLVGRVYKGLLDAGDHTFSWQLERSAKSAGAGIYMVTVEIGNSSVSRTVTLVR